MKTKIIRQSIIFDAAPRQLYDMLLDSKKHARFTGKKASVSKKAGGNFSVYDGRIEGKNLKLKPDKKIVQEWAMPKAKGWPKGHVSRVSFSFHKRGKRTRLYLYHSDVPSGPAKEIKSGWHQAYWKRMKKILKGGA